MSVKVMYGELRQKIVDSGLKPLDEAELRAEIDERRGIMDFTNTTTSYIHVGGTIPITGSITYTSPAARWNFCPSDGQKLESHWKHCPSCGVQIPGFMFGQISPTYGPWTYVKTCSTEEPCLMEGLAQQYPGQALHVCCSCPKCSPRC